MATAPFTSSLPDAHLIAFLMGPVSINLASCGNNLVPSLARAYGCTIADDGTQVTLFLPVSRSRALLADLRAGSAVSATFSRPLTHQTLQFKGTGARVLPLKPGNRELMINYGKAFAEEIQNLGYSADFARAMMQPCTEDALSVVFTPTDLYEQTPGLNAGQRLEPSA